MKRRITMDETTQVLAEIGTTLATLAAKGTVSSVTKKVRALKTEKDSEKLRTTYDELLNEVLQEREEAVRIAQAYKSELDRIEISDEDIEHLHNTVSQILELLKKVSGAPDEITVENNDEKSNSQLEIFEQVKEFISVDTLKTMQLLGFNYKAAIGEPLTILCADAISSWGKKGNATANKYGNKQHKR